MKRNVRGWRIGDSHQKSKLSDQDVELMRELHEEHGLGAVEIARKFECNFNTCYSILKYRSRYA